MGLILVTGAAGFVGQAACRGLLTAGEEVRAVVRFDADPLPAGVEHCIIGDIGTGTDWRSALTGVDVFVHLAARVHVMREQASDPLAEFRRVNVGGTLNLARQAAQAGVRRFIFLSSIKVNGEETKTWHPFTEDDRPGPLDAYAISKHEAEQGLRAIARQTGMEVVIIRPPLVYGPGVKGNFLTMLRWLEKGLPLPLGSIQNKRSLLALDNLVDFIMVCLDHPATANQTFLVADGEDLSTTELLRRTSVALGRPARLLPIPHAIMQSGLKLMGKGDLAQRLCGSLQVDISKARTLLGWKPPISVDEGLRRTAQGFFA